MVTDLTDPAVAGMVPFSVVDHACRATCDGAEGWGLFELGTFGRHDPSGFAGLRLRGSLSGDRRHRLGTLRSRASADGIDSGGTSVPP